MNGGPGQHGGANDLGLSLRRLLPLDAGRASAALGLFVAGDSAGRTARKTEPPAAKAVLPSVSSRMPRGLPRGDPASSPFLDPPVVRAAFAPVLLTLLAERVVHGG